MKTNCIKALAAVIAMVAISQAQASGYDVTSQLPAPSLKPALLVPEKAPAISKPAEIIPLRPSPMPVRPIYKSDIPAQFQLAVNGNDDGCIKIPVKPIRRPIGTIVCCG